MSQSGMEEAAPPAGDSGHSSGALEAALLQLGHFGLYQRYVLLLLCLAHVLGAMSSLSYVFVEEQVPFRCVVPECEAAGGVAAGGAAAGPQYEAAQARALSPEDEPCRRYAPLLPPPPAHSSNCSRAGYHRTDTVQCDSFVYQRTDTLYSEFGLACRSRRPPAGWVRAAALPLALLLTGYVADRFGRRAALCALAGCAGALGVARGCARSHRAYLALEFAGVTLGRGFTGAAYIMVMEVARPSLRASFASATGVSLGAGGALLALLARRAGGWRRLLWAVHTPVLLLPLYRLLLPESVRWLHAAGHKTRVQRHLRRAALCNKVKINEELLEALDVNKTSATERATAAGNPWAQLARSRVMLGRLALCGWCRAAAATLRRGLASPPARLARDMHVDFALSMGMEVVASLLLMMALERFGRKRSILAAFLASGAACIAPCVVSHARTGLALQFGGELSITFASSSLRVLTAELFPTRTRSSALAGCELVGWLSTVLASWAPLPGATSQALLCGSVAVTAVLAVLLVPETRRAPLPHSVRDAELLRAAPPAPTAPAAPPPPSAPRVIAADA